MTKNTKPKPEPAQQQLQAVTLRLADEDIALLDKTANALMLPGDSEKNRSRAARVLFARVRRAKV